MALASSTESKDRGRRMSEMLADSRFAMATLNASPRDTRSKWSARSKIVSNSTSLWRASNWLMPSTISRRVVASEALASPTSKSINAAWGDSSGFRPEASSRDRTPSRPSSNTSCRSFVAKDSDSNAFMDESARESGIAPLRRRTCQIPSWACSIPIALARRGMLPILLRSRIASRWAPIVSSLSEGESLYSANCSPNRGYARISRLTIAGEKGSARLRSTSEIARKIRNGSFSITFRQSANIASMTSSASFHPDADAVSFPSYLPCGCSMKRSFHGWIPPGMRGWPPDEKSTRVDSSSRSALARKIGRAGPGLVTLPRTAA